MLERCSQSSYASKQVHEKLENLMYRRTHQKTTSGEVDSGSHNLPHIKQTEEILKAE